MIIVCITFLFSPCLIKLFSGYPCPACGTRRAMVAALKGDFIISFYINPYGLLFLLLAVLVCTGFLYDKLSCSHFFNNLYKRIECVFKNKIIIALFALLMLLNWVWNIKKCM
ncbi:hypothetical protein EZS27_011154 [termite gut metagenome]|uniref:DUF2752 domain-containing protein n=1 Tax=termite gut metagenome TaxID=433724 RepID=A0A5J4S4G1_9ZZZZ